MKSKNKKTKFLNFLKKNNWKFSQLKKFDSFESIKFVSMFEKKIKKKINFLEIRNKEISFFLNKINNDL